MNRTIVHFEIPANDPEKLAAFYRGLFGWKMVMPKQEVPEMGSFAVCLDPEGNASASGKRRLSRGYHG
ncbi:MAG: VOC family protein [Dehalococcoidia bacterium]|nr:VOC family protein [Dehalococcoidia bacterium]